MSSPSTGVTHVLRVKHSPLFTIERIYKHWDPWMWDPSHPAHSLFELLPSGQLYQRVVILYSLTLQSSEHQNDQTQKQFLPSGNPSHEHLTIIMVHTLFIHLFILHTYLVYNSIAHRIIYLYIENCPLLYLYIQLSICILLFLIYVFFFYSSLYYLCFFVLKLLGNY